MAWKALHKTLENLGTTWNALERLVTPYYGLEHPLNALKYTLGIALERLITSWHALEVPLECIGTPWNVLEHLRTPWNALKRLGTPWNALE